MTVIKATTRSVQQILEQQISKWQALEKERERKTEPVLKVITLSREPGSGGSLIASRVAAALNLKLFHRDINKWVAESAQMDAMDVEVLDEKDHSIVEGWMSALTRERRLWPDEYLRHLKKVVIEIGRGEGGVIVGRGVNFILPPGSFLSVRTIAPLEDRIANICKMLGVDDKEAKQRVLRREANRKAFVKRYFQKDGSDPTMYDLVVNTKCITIDAAVGLIVTAWKAMGGCERAETSR